MRMMELPSHVLVHAILERLDDAQVVMRVSKEVRRLLVETGTRPLRLSLRVSDAEQQGHAAALALASARGCGPVHLQLTGAATALARAQALLARMPDPSAVTRLTLRAFNIACAASSSTPVVVLPNVRMLTLSDCARGYDELDHLLDMAPNACELQLVDCSVCAWTLRRPRPSLRALRMCDTACGAAFARSLPALEALTVDRAAGVHAVASVAQACARLARVSVGRLVYGGPGGAGEAAAGEAGRVDVTVTGSTLDLDAAAGLPDRFHVTWQPADASRRCLVQQVLEQPAATVARLEGRLRLRLHPGAQLGCNAALCSLLPQLAPLLRGSPGGLGAQLYMHNDWGYRRTRPEDLAAQATTLCRELGRGLRGLTLVISDRPLLPWTAPMGPPPGYFEHPGCRCPVYGVAGGGAAPLYTAEERARAWEAVRAACETEAAPWLPALLDLTGLCARCRDARLAAWNAEAATNCAIAQCDRAE